MSNFGNKDAGTALPTEAKRVNAAAVNAFIAIAFTVINTITYYTEIGGFFLFSLYFPYIWFEPGAPADCILAIAVVAVFGLLAGFAKKKPECVYGLLVLTVLDTAFLIFEVVLLVEDGYAEVGDFITEIIFHIWLLVIMAMGAASVKKYKAYLAGTADPYGIPRQYGVPQPGVPQYGVPQYGVPQQPGEPQYDVPQYGVPQQPGVPQYDVPQYGVPQQPDIPQYDAPQNYEGTNNISSMNDKQYKDF